VLALCSPVGPDPTLRPHSVSSSFSWTLVNRVMLIAVLPRPRVNSNQWSHVLSDYRDETTEPESPVPFYSKLPQRAVCGVLVHALRATRLNVMHLEKAENSITWENASCMSVAFLTASLTATSATSSAHTDWWHGLMLSVISTWKISRLWVCGDGIQQAGPRSRRRIGRNAVQWQLLTALCHSLSIS
jgi:hypothetical protein